jgi:hypothetical protein
MRSAALVAPGARSPVSSEPSFSRTRWTTVSLFLKVTIIPPKAAGFGVNERAPLLLVIEMVAGPVAPGEGAVGLLEPDPPPQPDALVRTRIAAAVNVRSLMAFLSKMRNADCSAS